jgi:plasmid stabilization system protein ParE
MVRWSAPARNDLRQIYDYIARDSRYYARVVIDKIVTSTEKLERFPDIGRVVPEIGDDNVKELFVYSYRILYEITPDAIEVLAIVHGKRDFPKDRT